MNLSRKWLSDYVDVSDINNKDYCDRMTDTGSKVEGFEVLCSDIENVVIGTITKISKHENSDHLQICQVNVGEENDIQIVTAAKNVFEGAVVPVAKAPAKLPGEIVIKTGKLRGVESQGMFCSIAELNLTTHDMPSAIENGIFILNDLEEAESFTLGMAIKAQQLGPEGKIVANITLFAVLIYELVGPLLTKISLEKAGEIKPEHRTTARHDGAKKALHEKVK